MKKIKQQLVIFICFCLIFILFFNTVNANLKNNNIDIISLYQKQIIPSRLIITQIEDGVGLTVTIKNIGGKNVNDISITVSTKNGLFLFLPRKEFYINSIATHMDQSIKVPIFGIGMGQITEYPQITLTIYSSNTAVINKTYTFRVIGAFCSVIGEFFNSPRSYQGYTLFSPEYTTFTFLMNNNAEIIHEWKSDYIQGLPVYLDEEGCLIRGCSKINNLVFTSGGFTGRVEKRDWNNNLIWEFDYSTDQYCLHHDIEPLPNGNILMIAWEKKTTQEAIEQGRNPNKIRQNMVWPDSIIEVKPIGFSDYEIVWEWHVWDHLIQQFDPLKDNYGIISEYPELIDINYGGIQADWTHINSVDYNDDLDQILLSVHNFNEIWIIDHSTTTEEASGHIGGRYGKGGDLLYRWGNPIAYGQGIKQEQKFFGQHDAQWVNKNYPGGGNILIFNNGQGRPNGEYSSIEEIIPPINENGDYFLETNKAYGPNYPVWYYISSPPELFFSNHISGVQRQPNGNTLICSGADGKFFEVTKEGHTVWSYVNTFPDVFNNHVFKILRYPLDYPGIQTS